jgi:hypothetical protein
MDQPEGTAKATISPARASASPPSAPAPTSTRCSTRPCAIRCRATRSSPASRSRCSRCSRPGAELDSRFDPLPRDPDRMCGFAQVRRRVDVSVPRDGARRPRAVSDPRAKVST